MDKAHSAIMDGIEAFFEIQNGPNPLSSTEIRKLAQKRPEKWGKFLKYAEQMEMAANKTSEK
jgi:hypothetical protein